MIGILTGRNLVTAHIYRMGLTEREVCRKCQEKGTRETIEHLLCSCPALARLRFKHFEAPQYETLEDVSLMNFCWNSRQVQASWRKEALRWRDNTIFVTHYARGRHKRNEKKLRSKKYVANKHTHICITAHDGHYIKPQHLNVHQVNTTS